jgi:hypothetical protein
MKGVFWNSNGFKDLKKHKFISDLTKENNLNFIAISEAGRSDFTPRFLKNLCFIFGTVKLQRVGLVAFYLELICSFMTLVQLMREIIT